MPKGKKKPHSYGGGSESDSGSSEEYFYQGERSPPGSTRHSSRSSESGSWSSNLFGTPNSSRHSANALYEDEEYHHPPQGSNDTAFWTADFGNPEIDIIDRHGNHYNISPMPMFARAILIPGIIIAIIIGISYATSKKIVLSTVYIGIIVGIFTWLVGWGRNISAMISTRYGVQIYNNIAIAVALIVLGTIGGVIFTLSTGSKKWIDGILLMNVCILGFAYLLILGHIIF